MAKVLRGAAMAGAAVLAASAAFAQVPPDIAAKLHAMGRGLGLESGAIYAPLQPKPPYAGIRVERDLAYGPDPLERIDVFTPEGKAPRGGRPIVVFLHGGGLTGGSRVQGTTPFYDNIMVWAARHGLVGVNMDYRLAPKDSWPAGAEDVGGVARWLHANAGKYGGDPGRIFFWGHSAGAMHVADYLANPQVQGPNGPGMAGAILMSGVYGGQPGPYYGDEAAALARASLPGLVRSTVPLMVITAELDFEALNKEAMDLEKARCAAGRCPRYLMVKDHDHLSEGVAVGTADESVSGPVLSFIQTSNRTPK